MRIRKWWEYQVIECTRAEMFSTLTIKGSDGWELVSIGWGDTVTLVFKIKMQRAE